MRTENQPCKERGEEHCRNKEEWYTGLKDGRNWMYSRNLKKIKQANRQLLSKLHELSAFICMSTVLSPQTVVE